MNFIDFIIGGLLMNAMPHLVLGLNKTHFLGLFGYSPKGNIAYALLQLVICIAIFSYNYSFKELFNNGFLLGGVTVLVLFFGFGKLMVKFYEKK